MNSKKSVYILLPLVIVIWGIVIYKFLNIKGDYTDNRIYDEKIETAIISKNVDKNYNLLLNYMDPFLSSLDNTNLLNNNKDVHKLKKRNENGTNRRQSEINLSYLGILINESKNKKVGLLEIEDKRYLLSDNDVQNGVMILRLCSDSVIYKIGKDIKVAYKKH